MPTTIPVNDLLSSSPANSPEIQSAVIDVIKSGWWLNGRCTEEFCKKFASYIGVENCISVANGTDALEIALRALSSLSSPNKNEVITVANAGGYSSIACFQSGLKPVYVDIDEKSQLADLDSILQAANDNTLAIIITHLYGGVFDVSKLKENLKKRNINVFILEDCAQAHGAELRGKKVGSLGDVATFSFYPTKNLGACGDAGAIVTSDPQITERTNQLRQYGWQHKYNIAISGGRNSRMDEIQAVILSSLLDDLDAQNERRRYILDRYQEALPSEITLVRSENGTVGHLAVLLCNDRDALRQHLTAYGIGTDIHYPILDCDQVGWQSLDHTAMDLSIARSSTTKLLTLPCYPSMDEQQVNRICEVLSQWK